MECKTYSKLTGLHSFLMASSERTRFYDLVDYLAEKDKVRRIYTTDVCRFRLNNISKDVLTANSKEPWPTVVHLNSSWPSINGCTPTCSHKRNRKRKHRTKLIAQPQRRQALAPKLRRKLHGGQARKNCDAIPLVAGYDCLSTNYMVIVADHLYLQQMCFS